MWGTAVGNIVVGLRYGSLVLKYLEIYPSNIRRFPVSVVKSYDMPLQRNMCFSGKKEPVSLSWGDFPEASFAPF